VLGLAYAGHAQRVAIVHADVLKRGTLLAIDEVKEGRHVQVVEADAGRCVPDADQLFRMGIAERLQKHAVDHAEDHRIGADADRKRDQDDRREKRGTKQTAEYLLELSEKEIHRKPPVYRFWSRTEHGHNPDYV